MSTLRPNIQEKIRQHITHTLQPLGLFELESLLFQDKKALLTLSVSPENKILKEDCAALEQTLASSVRSLFEIEISIVFTIHKKDRKKPPHNFEKFSLPTGSILPVVSGKGGVGKSTLALHIARSLLKQGLKVGILDCDIYGPSLHLLLAINERPETEGNPPKIIPLCAHGLYAMSIAFLLEKEGPLVWRGLMAQKALMQLLHGVAWPQDLDILILDMPPGTGDIHLSLAQKVSMTGAIIVSTPEKLAVQDAKKAANMFHKLHVPIIGIIENMSGFQNPQTGECLNMFPSQALRSWADKEKHSILCTLPFSPLLAQACEEGCPEKVDEDRKINDQLTQATQYILKSLSGGTKFI